MDVNTYYKNFTDWGLKWQIIQTSNPKAQWLKLMSEYGELCDNLAKGRDCKDDIGDMAVVCHMIGGMKDGISQHPTTHTYATMDVAISELHDLLGIVHRRILQDLNTRLHLADVLITLSAIARLQGYEYTDCLEVAWNAIKNRKGKLSASGVLIKEGDTGVAA